ncbi:YaaC family protein [Pseudalkalibacillus caeni]|uniref:YaaC n=1 Tax=Exobacillus caeni TaxID=2574798 RepID=A0A5R9EUW7_9BACL|nr:YaaC family protein [Pseudalkalibacillus caeni]TLS35002.1 hypothetical protein FCL54_22625 [Pseudalkalibacillus caeni]
MDSFTEIWKPAVVFQSSPYVQAYLKKNYEKNKLSEPESKSYDNCYPFIYYLEHGRKYYQHASIAEMELKPVLLFYGMVQLLKACLLTVDPEYPNETTVLAHGVTSRKRKKRNYVFLQDEVKGQKNGLFEYFSRKLFHVKQSEGEKYRMEMLLKRIPELNDLFYTLFSRNTSFILEPAGRNDYKVSSSIIDSLKMTHERFIDFLLSQEVSSLCKIENKTDYFHLTFEKPIANDCPPFYQDFNGNCFLPGEREGYLELHEVMSHYLILYNLSMICRYETEWWGDLFHSFASYDLSFITRFLEVTAYKIPYLLLKFLTENAED